MTKKRDPRLAKAGVSGYNKPKRTPKHPTKSHVVVAKTEIKLKLFVSVNKVLEVLVKILNLKKIKLVKDHITLGIMHKMLTLLS